MKKIMFFVVSLFLIMPMVYAETGYVTDKTGANMRDYPSTDNKKSNVIIKIPYNTSFYISNLEAATGSGCSKAWYYVYYNGEYGYLCSNLVALEGDLSTSYNRPWTTPKKAIVGGAEVIGKNYISKGQSNSYLKKFNVNPKGYYSVFNHQYQANLRAPSGEAITTYNSLNSNKLLDKAYDFLIPVYKNMPVQSYSYTGLYSGFDMPTTTETDSNFEKSIESFDDTYKPYLRYLHKKHPLWTFTALITNLDFNEVYLNEKPISSIEISSKYCEQNPYKVTESGWCIATDDATKYFIDPRNFLTEKYVFMFQNLSYSNLITEASVQSILNGTFMSGKSTLDNQTYASIFVEAGKNEKANVSPLYLASLSIQEVGSNGSIATSGAEFEYDGYTYKGLYNFFNIGAYSSESNPAKAGLVYANGGRGVSNSVVTPDDKNDSNKNTNNNNQSGDSGTKVLTTVEIDNMFIKMLSLSKVDSYVRGYSLGTTLKTIKSKVGSLANIVIKDSSGNILSDNDTIGTGCTISISNSNGSKKYIYAMYGDINGDGKINSADLLKLRQHLLGTNVLTGANLVSASLTDDNNINSADLLKLRQYLLGTSDIKQ